MELTTQSPFNNPNLIQVTGSVNAINIAKFKPSTLLALIPVHALALVGKGSKFKSNSLINCD